MTTRAWTRLGTAATLLTTSMLCGQEFEEPPRGTPLQDVVAYGIDSSTYELFRYGFADDRSERLGIVRDQAGEVVCDVQGLALIPDGPHRGLYGVANYFLTKPSRLVAIGVADASARLASSVVGFEKIEGLVASPDPDTGEWSLVGVAREPQTCLVRIDPATGAARSIMTTTNRYHALARAADGTLYGTTRNMAALWQIDVEAGTETLVAALDEYRGVTALEFAFGDSGVGTDIVVPDARGVSAEWTARGALFGLADNEDALLIIDPATGRTREWPAGLDRVTFDGLVFTTRTRDPFQPFVTVTE
jgi:hypothetical protein